MNNIKQVGAPVTAKRLSPVQKGIIFCNSSTGRTLIISPAPNVNFSVNANFKNEHYVQVEVWENLLDEFIEETLYLSENIFFKKYSGSKLMTTKFTTVFD